MEKPKPAGFTNGRAPSFKVIWTADAIAHRIGVSADFVRDTLAKAEGTPLKKVGGRYCAVEEELLAFFRQS